MIGNSIAILVNKVDCGTVTLGLWVPKELKVTPIDSLELAKICGIVRTTTFERSSAPQGQ